MKKWFELLSKRQKIWLFATTLVVLFIILLSPLLTPEQSIDTKNIFNTNQSIIQVARELEMTPKAFTKELGLDSDVAKRRPIKSFGISEIELSGTIEKILSRPNGNSKLFIYLAIVLFALVFLARIGRPDEAEKKTRKYWYPRIIYNTMLIYTIIVCGFVLGRVPNPMEYTTKMFKVFAGLYPDPTNIFIIFGFFIFLAIIGNKIICGWACPFGALQEIIYSLPILKEMKQKKLPFWLTNTIRVTLFTIMLLFFLDTSTRQGYTVYHYLNPFNLFDMSFEYLSIIATIVLALLISFGFYRPFCQIICPFGLISWFFERISLFSIKIDKLSCTKCGACNGICPTRALDSMVNKKPMPPDCFSCARCLNACPVDAIKYKK